MGSRQLSVEIKVGDSISLNGGRIVITLEEKSGQRARLRFSADETVGIEPIRARPIETEELNHGA